jgi:hypothetical protein
MKENSFSSKIMGELIRNLNLLSYNKRNLIQDTWSGDGEYENDSDEEFMKMILAEPNENKLNELEFKCQEIAPNKRKYLINSINDLLAEINFFILIHR